LIFVLKHRFINLNEIKFGFPKFTCVFKFCELKKTPLKEEDIPLNVVD